jgi:hypothetical protein
MSSSRPIPGKEDDEASHAFAAFGGLVLRRPRPAEPAGPGYPEGLQQSVTMTMRARMARPDPNLPAPGYRMTTATMNVHLRNRM